MRLGGEPHSIYRRRPRNLEREDPTVRTVRSDWRRLPARVENIVTDVGIELRRSVLGDDLFLLALTRLDESAPARQVLEAEGVTADVVLADVRTGGDGGTSPRHGMTYAPAYYSMYGRADDADFRPARKAHPAFLVRGLAGLAQRLRDAGAPVVDDEDGVYVSDPFGNRIELLERGDTLLGPP
jgi:catechol 2,3-dioxygenase-like lactoylglutathione lyase family enzyme